MKNFNCIVASTFLLMVMASCAKNFDGDKVTVVRGYVIDSVKNKKLPNAKVSIYGCVHTTFKISCSNLIATTRTDTNGEFEISFKPNGRYTGFEAQIDYDENYDFSSKISINGDTENTIVITAREFNYLKTRLIITNNPFNKLFVRSRNTGHILYGQSLDTIIMNRVLPNSLNSIIYSTWDSSVGKYRQLIDTFSVGNQDTVNYMKVLPDVSTFPTR